MTNLELRLATILELEKGSASASDCKSNRQPEIANYGT